MTPLERAARALCEARGEDGLPILNLDPDFGDYPLTQEGTDDLNPFTEADVLALARAVLQAIREPSIAMGKAYYGEDWGVEQLPSLSEVWATLIDAALEEG